VRTPITFCPRHPMASSAVHLVKSQAGTQYFVCCWPGRALRGNTAKSRLQHHAANLSLPCGWRNICCNRQRTQQPCPKNNEPKAHDGKRDKKDHGLAMSNVQVITSLLPRWNLTEFSWLSNFSADRRSHRPNTLKPSVRRIFSADARSGGLSGLILTPPWVLINRDGLCAESKVWIPTRRKTINCRRRKRSACPLEPQGLVLPSPADWLKPRSVVLSPEEHSPGAHSGTMTEARSCAALRSLPDRSYRRHRG
jgi:hypothetical protein